MKMDSGLVGKELRGWEGGGKFWRSKQAILPRSKEAISPEWLVMDT